MRWLVYLNGVLTEKDVAPADPAIYKTPAYTVIAFCKNTAVLDMLRTEVGDERFFAGWRRVFEEYDASVDGFDTVRDVFSRTTGTDMRWFFDQWFFQSGCPEIATEHAVNEDTVTITLRQTQKQPPFRLNSEVAVRGRNGEVIREKVVLTGRETRLTVQAAFPIQEVVFDPEDRLLLRRAVVTTDLSPHEIIGRVMPAALLPAPSTRQRFRRRLLTWYRANGRDLPWRRTADPYHILVSEVMLQQTQVDRVLPKYREWLDKYPSLSHLAAADEADVSQTWRPLGYNIRPRRLHAIARESVVRYGGALPSDAETLLSFDGIGAYTAGAIRSFAFGQRAAILDTNVARVLFRVFVARGDSKAHAMRKRLWSISEALVPHKHVFEFNQGLMDLGALVCTPRKPKCPACPMKGFCRSRASYAAASSGERA